MKLWISDVETDICKAGGKEFKHWNSLQRTKEFLEELNLAVGIPTSRLISIGSGGHNKSRTFGHHNTRTRVSFKIFQINED